MDDKFAIGDKVDNSPRDRFVGTVVAVYTTKSGEMRYAVDMEVTAFFGSVVNTQ